MSVPTYTYKLYFTCTIVITNMFGSGIVHFFSALNTRKTV